MIFSKHICFGYLRSFPFRSKEFWTENARCRLSGNHETNAERKWKKAETIVISSIIRRTPNVTELQIWTFGWNDWKRVTGTLDEKWEVKCILGLWDSSKYRTIVHAFEKAKNCSKSQYHLTLCVQSIVASCWFLLSEHESRICHINIFSRLHNLLSRFVLLRKTRATQT